MVDSFRLIAQTIVKNILKNCKYELIISGYSLAGALAILFGYEWIRQGLCNKYKNLKIKVVTFGAPPVLFCEKMFRDEMNKNSNFIKLKEICHLYFNKLDPIPRVINLCKIFNNIRDFTFAFHFCVFTFVFHFNVIISVTFVLSLLCFIIMFHFNVIIKTQK